MSNAYEVGDWVITNVPTRNKYKERVYGMITAIEQGPLMVTYVIEIPSRDVYVSLEDIVAPYHRPHGHTGVIA